MHFIGRAVQFHEQAAVCSLYMFTGCFTFCESTIAVGISHSVRAADAAHVAPSPFLIIRGAHRRPDALFHLGVRPLGLKTERSVIRNTGG